ncbi:MAG: hypothetical protein M0T74_13585 [Desulfitobacterium hafniense]|nr:hypothetical protein [Desulfitobacterium hafniense]
MGVTIQTLEMRGLKREVFLDYFLDLGGALIDGEQIHGPGWEVRLSTEQAITLGSITLPVVHVTFLAEKEIVLERIQAFRMRFLSAGG